MALEIPFPEIPRVVYEINPLKEVVCQLRYPTQLRLESDLPADFQDAIKSDYPVMNRSEELSIEIAASVGGGLTPNLRQQARPKYEFQSEDQAFKVVLSSDAIGISWLKYERWEKFREVISDVFQKFIEIYQPPYITRCGLRYINIIDSAEVQFEPEKVVDMISDELLGNFHRKLYESGRKYDLEEAFTIDLGEEGSFVRVVHGLIKRQPDERVGYKFDSDYWTEGKLESNAGTICDRLDTFRIGAGRAFRWAITDALHDNLRPTPVD